MLILIVGGGQHIFATASMKYTGT